LQRKRLAAASAAAFAAAAILAGPASTFAATGVGTLKTDGNPVPLGIDDPAPTLSWKLTTPDRGVSQDGYQVVVATTAAKAAAGVGDVWDSGQVASDAIAATYAGPALTSRTRYYWSVRSEEGSTWSGWAPAAWFETAYMKASEWKGSWISGPPRTTAPETAAQGSADDACCTKAATTLSAAAAAGDSVARVASTTGFAAGQPITLDAGANAETATVGTVGTGAASTTAAAPVAAGDTNIPVAAVSGFSAGAPLTIGGQTVTIENVGSAAGAATTLFGAAAAGAMNVKVSSTAGFTVGQRALIENEVRTVSAVGTQGRATTLAAAAAAGATSIKVASVTGIAVGDPLQIGSGATLEVRTVAGVGSAGANGTGLTLDLALSSAQASGGAVRDQGTGISLTSALASAHAQGAAARGLGSGIDVTPAIGAAAATGAAVGTPGSGLTLTSPLTKPHASGAAVAGPDPKDVCRPKGDFPNAGACAPIRPTELLRKDFSVAPVSQHGAVVSARVYSSGLGWDNMTLNGSKTEPDGWLNPGFTSYDQTVLYTTDDITSLIEQDATSPTENVIAAELAAGRYDSDAKPSNHGWENAQWRAEETLRADLYVSYADGTQQLVKSDDSWRTSIDGPTRLADYDDGETYDARDRIPGWDTPSYDASTWSSARLVTGPAGKVQAQKEQLNKDVDDVPNSVGDDGTRLFPEWSPSAGTYAWDTLKQRTGWATVSIWGAQPGQVIRIVNVERRNAVSVAGGVITGPQQGALQLPGNLSQQYYVSDGSGTETHPEVYHPQFWFGGFQWVLVSGSGGAALPDDVHVMVDSVSEVRTAMPETGTFSSDNPLVNSIYTALQGSVAGDFEVGQVMDTPTYEKDGWTGDTQLMAPTASLLFDTQNQFQKTSEDVVDSQRIGDAMGGLGGQISFLVPSDNRYGYCSPSTASNTCASSPSVTVFKDTNGGDTPIWDALLHIAPWQLYQSYGDVSGLRGAYPAMVKYLDTWIPNWQQAYHDHVNANVNYLVTSHLGDWDPPNGREGNAAEGTNYAAPTVVAPSSSAYVAYLAQITAQAARVLGKPDDAAHFDALYEHVKADYNSAWWDASVGYYRENATQAFSQTEQVLPLAFGLVPDGQRAALQAKLVDDVLVTRHGHEELGITGARWILPVLTEAAHEGVANAGRAAYAIATQTTYPSFGYFQALGWTGIGESWESTSRTRDHEMYGTIGQWMYENLAGIQATSPAYRTIAIKPLIVPDAGIDHAAASYDSVQGTISSNWTRSEAGITLHVTIPPNTTAKVYVPGTDPSKIGESGAGTTVLAQRSPGVSLVDVQDDATVYRVGSGSYTFVVGPGLFDSTSASGGVGGSVAPTLSLTLGTAPTFGSFTPGIARDYTASETATVTSSAGDASLSVADPSATATGHLVNGTFSLPQPLQVDATSAGASGGAFAPVGSASSPTSLLAYGGPVANDAATIGFKQSIGADDALRTGSYSKTLTFTLSTTTP